MTDTTSRQSAQISYLYSEIASIISGGGGGVPTSSDLEDVLLNGNSATNSILLDNTGTGTNVISLLPNATINNPHIELTDGTITNTINKNGYTTRNNNANSTHFLNFVNASATSTHAIQQTTGIECNPSTKTITATTFVGALTGNASSATTATTATNATNVGLTSDNTNGTYYIPFAKTSGSGNKPLFIDDVTTPLTYNPSTSNLSTSTINSIPIGQGVGSISTNTRVGILALNSGSLSGDRNSAFGNNALQGNTTGGNNVAFGSFALNGNTTGNGNNSVGQSSLLSNTIGSFNCAFGNSSLQNNSTGGNNTSNGFQTLTSNTTGNGNTAVGANALVNNTTGSNNIAIGSNAGTATSPSGSITTASNQICMGNNSHTNAFVKVAWTITSDLRDKTNLKPIIHGLDFVNQLKPTEFQFREERGSEEIQEGGRIHYGFIAQDILALEGDKPVIIDNNDDECLKYTESHLIPVLVNAIKELTARVQALEAGK
jgi:trimeric autotransporter adhesin